MQTVTITHESPDDTPLFRARTNGHQAIGRTAGEAIDGLSAYLGGARGTTIILIQKIGGDEFFGAAQVSRLKDLMARWRSARDLGAQLSSAEQQELEALVEAELDASARRAAALADQLPQ